MDVRRSSVRVEVRPRGLRLATAGASDGGLDDSLSVHAIAPDTSGLGITMSISCRTDPCWVLWADRQARDRTSDPLPHYPDRETVIEVLDARTGLDRVDVEFLASCQYRLPTPCLTVSCDSCGAGPNNDADERTTHFADLAQARAYLDGW